MWSSVLFLCACSTQESAVSYYAQSIGGHLSLMRQRVPVEEVVLNAEPELKARLEVSQEIRQFAIDALSLPNNQSYTTYVELNRPYIVWNVFAAETLSLEIKQWCYLVIGCANYRGYYKQARAETYAEGLAEEGYDVMVAGISAYSTLGWFADPLTSALIRRNGANLAELIFHELAHQAVFIKDDSKFNEAFATVVGEQGALRWLEETERFDMLARYQRQQAVYDDFLNLLRQTRQQLQSNYQSAKTDVEKLQKKDEIFTQMKMNYERLKQERWGGEAWYQSWFDRPLNNSRFVSMATYRDLVPAFEQLFERCGNDFKRFYERVEIIGKSKEKRLDVAC